MPDDAPIQAVSFDCYGTLVDWQTGLERSLLFILREKPDAPGLDNVLAAWQRHERELTSGKEGYRRYRDVLAAALERAFEEMEVVYEPRDGFRLAKDMGRWEPFPDASPALRELRDMGLRLAVFSNTDDDILAATVKRIGVPFDLLLTAEQVKAYKPDEAVFREGLKRLDLPPGEVLHVSSSAFHDLEPATRLGMPTFWVDREGLGETELQVDGMARDLLGLTATLRPT